MAIALLSAAHVTKGSTDTHGFTTVGLEIDTSGASLLVAILGDYQGATLATLSDSKSNSGWLYRTAYAIASGPRVRLAYCANPTAGGSHALTLTSAGGFPVLCVAAFSGVALTTPYERESGATGSGGTQATGSITPAEDGELIISGVIWYPGLTVSINESMTIIDQNNFVSGQHYGGSLAYKVQATATAVNPTWSGATFTGVAAAVAAFKVAAVAADPFPAWVSHRNLYAPLLAQ